MIYSLDNPHTKYQWYLFFDVKDFPCVLLSSSSSHLNQFNFSFGSFPNTFVSRVINSSRPYINQYCNYSDQIHDIPYILTFCILAEYDTFGIWTQVCNVGNTSSWIFNKHFCANFLYFSLSSLFQHQYFISLKFLCLRGSWGGAMLLWWWMMARMKGGLFFLSTNHFSGYKPNPFKISIKHYFWLHTARCVGVGAKV